MGKQITGSCHNSIEPDESKTRYGGFYRTLKPFPAKQKFPTLTEAKGDEVSLMDTSTKKTHAMSERKHSLICCLSVKVVQDISNDFYKNIYESVQLSEMPKIHGEDRDSGEENNKISAMKKPKLKKNNRSDPAELSQERPSSRTSTPSPSKKPSKRPVRRVQSMWSTLKTVVPHRLKNRHKNELSCSGRLGSSDPDVSSSNLASLAKTPVDDSGIRSSEAKLLNDTSSLSDPNLNRQDFVGNTNCHTEKKALVITTREDQTDSGLESMESTTLKQRQNTLRKHAFFQVDVHLRSGKDLLAKDSCGTSDPYVKFKLGGRQLYKSRTIPKTLDPYWDEFFCLPVEDVFEPLYVRVYDYDFGLQDDYMGSAQVDLTCLELNKPTDVTLPLTDSGLPDDPKQWGSIQLTLTLIPKTQMDKEQYFNKGLKVTADATLKKQKIQLWDSVVTIVLVEGKNLFPMDENGLSDPYVKFRLGNEKYRSK
ncbi:multiple C2 and transmembrane domain-containing protein 2-like, partial [Limulus polyphemus]|uniref:Multiple C2 and transmembrane domain-containing protein 2-like n=1 Tax=Limulus polyphemus TaxID=6850 RepID=A0ABM1T1B4_LIMPO